jgi:hypothetical protein
MWGLKLESNSPTSSSSYLMQCPCLLLSPLLLLLLLLPCGRAETWASSSCELTAELVSNESKECAGSEAAARGGGGGGGLLARLRGAGEVFASGGRFLISKAEEFRLPDDRQHVSTAASLYLPLSACLSNCPSQHVRALAQHARTHMHNCTPTHPHQYTHSIQK